VAPLHGHGTQVKAEVTIEDKDVGFVNVRQSAKINLETFPFTHYGTVFATVRRVSADAVNDEKRGALLPAILKLKATQINVDGTDTDGQRRVSISAQPGFNG
jgi:hemolysin D